MTWVDVEGGADDRKKEKGGGSEPLPPHPPAFGRPLPTWLRARRRIGGDAG